MLFIFIFQESCYLITQTEYMRKQQKTNFFFVNNLILETQNTQYKKTHFYFNTRKKYIYVSDIRREIDI